jgi:hypothetical protein
MIDTVKHRKHGMEFPEARYFGYQQYYEKCVRRLREMDGLRTLGGFESGKKEKVSSREKPEQ